LVTKIKSKDGRHPIKLRLTYLRKNYDRAVGLSALVDEWDVKQERLRGKKFKDENLVLDAIEQKVKSVLIGLIAENAEVIPMQILDKSLGKTSSVEVCTVFGFFDEIIDSLKEAGSIKTAEAFKYTKLMLKKFYTRQNLTFDQITFQFIDKFRNFLASSHSINGISVVLRTLRSLYNKALNYGRFELKDYPWKKVSVKTQPTLKRAITKDELLRISKLDIEYGSRLWHSRNYFLFSYLTQGMNFKDLAELTWEDNVCNGRLVYRRSKTNDLFSIGVNDKIKSILDHYQNVFLGQDGLVFPIYKTGSDANQKANRVKKCLKYINEDIKTLGRLAEIENYKTLTFYVARHSFATALKKLGYSTSVISEAMGHSDERTTQIYLASFDTEVFDEANTQLL
jgi:integrase/recombinase XerD